MKFILSFFLLLFLFVSCDTRKLSETPMSKFVGTWVCESGIMKGVEFEIKRAEDGSYTGSVKKLNDEKFVKLLLEQDAVIVTKIERQSNFQFSLTERKLGHELFGLYDLETSTTRNVQFNNDGDIVEAGKSRVLYRKK